MGKSFFISRTLSRWQKFLLYINFTFSILIIGSYLATMINPNSFWPLAFLGLAYPIFLLFHLAFILFWLLKRNKWILLSVCTLLLGINHLRHFYQIRFSAGSAYDETKQQLKIMTWNVRVFNLYDEKNRESTRQAIFDVLKREDPDIILFQEFYHTDREGFFETKNEIRKFLRTKYIHEGYTHKLHHQQFFGLATLSSFPILSSGEITFENDENNNVIFSDIKVGEDTIRIYNAHLSSIRFQRGDYEFIGDTANSKKWLYPNQKVKFEEQKIITRLKNAFLKRAEQSEILLKHIATSPHPTVLGGDFNDTPVSYCYRLFKSRFNDAFIESGSGTGATYIGKFPSFRIDYIFHDPNLHSYQYTTHEEELSDHRAISCMIEFCED